LISQKGADESLQSLSVSHAFGFFDVHAANTAHASHAAAFIATLSTNFMLLIVPFSVHA